MRTGFRHTLPVVLLTGLSLALLPTPGHTQEISLRVDSDALYADVPFVLSLTAKDFDEKPAPEAPELVIPDCRVTYLGVSPSVSQGVQFINGRRTEWRQVTFVYRYRIEAPEGRYTIPAMTMIQGQKSTTTNPVQFTVQSLARTDDMQVHLLLPERPVWVGETFPVELEWVLRRDVGEHTFVVPLFDLDFVQVQPGPSTGKRTLTFNAGTLSVDLPYKQDSVAIGGAPYTRLHFSALITVNQAGPIMLDPVKVAARLQMGAGRDRFGFRVPQYRLYSAEDQPRRLNVRPLPVQGRPDSFENAIGSAFSISVRANRTVVQVGDPVGLQIRIRGDGPLQGLSLPQLDSREALDPNLFSVPDDKPIGELNLEENVKLFSVTLRVKSAEATEIPSIPFSYFDPETNEYRTVRSEPIALSVAGGAVVDASDVTVATPRLNGAAGSLTPEPAVISTGFATLIGADLSLSPVDGVFRSVWTAGDAAPWVVALYVFPVAIAGMRFWQVRTGTRRGRDTVMRKALQDVENALSSQAPASQAAARVVSTVRALARVTGQESALGNSALEQLETHAFDPQAGEKPLSGDTVAKIRQMARGWVADHRQATRRTGPALALLVGLLLSAGAVAQPGDTDRLDQAREIYQAALEEPDRVRRTRLFGEAQQMFSDLAPSHQHSPDFLTDWGNAALGAQDIGRATLAYRQALHLDPRHQRARTNLDWLRQRTPEWVPRPSQAGALDSLFFWHHGLSAASRLLIGAAAFGMAVLLLAPWPGRQTRKLRRLAVVFMLVWVATTTSAILERDSGSEAVLVTDGAILRSADSLGAPASLANPLPAGVELRLLESRGEWSRVALADGTPGWVHTTFIRVVRP